MKREEGYLLKKIADEYVLVPVGERAEEVNEVFTFTETAAYIYEHAEEAADIQELICIASRGYNVPESVVAEDVEEVVSFMKKKGLLR